MVRNRYRGSRRSGRSLSLFLMYLLLQREIKTPNAGPIYPSDTGGRGPKVLLVDCKNVFFYSQQEKALNFQVEGNTVTCTLVFIPVQLKSVVLDFFFKWRKGPMKAEVARAPSVGVVRPGCVQQVRAPAWARCTSRCLCRLYGVLCLLPSVHLVARTLAHTQLECPAMLLWTVG